MSEKTIIGVTGTIGTGKSTFSKKLAGDSRIYLDSDQLAKGLMKKGEPGYQPVVEEFGPSILGDDNEIDSDRLGEIVFSNSSNLEKLEEILHPLVIDKVAGIISNTDSDLIVVEIPLLFESGAEDLFDKTIALRAPEELVEKRMENRSFTAEEVRNRRSHQLSQSEKCKLADIVVDNQGSLEDLEEKAVELREKFMNQKTS